MHPRSTLAATLALALPLLAPPSAMTQASELPKRRPGQWEARLVTEQPAGGPTIVSQMCIDAATDREMMEFGLKVSKKSCPRFDMRKTVSGWVIDAECEFGPVRNATKTTITGDFQSSITFRIEGTTHGLPGSDGKPQPTMMVQTATWKGATCTDGMKPGDFSLGNGIRMNIRQMQQLQKMLPNVQIK